jgi:hypothetical protein
MTATRTSTPPAALPARRRWNPRILRLAVPVGVVIALVAVTLTAHLIQQTDHTDAAFLSPTSRAGIGAATLADRLTRRGVVIDRRTDTPAALRAASSGDVTLFIPAPDLVWPNYLGRLPGLPPSTHVVLVAPGPAQIGQTGLAVTTAGHRWAAAAPDPGCDQPWATGPAAARRWAYVALAGGRFSCYDGGVVEAAGLGASVTFVGASDAFRNDRLDEHANAAFATGLLARSGKVVWLDLHKKERPPPGPNPDPDADPLPTTQGPVSGPGEPADPDDPPPDDNQASGPTIFDAFPPALWASLTLLAVAAIALAAASARRVGAPVAEPLPVRVRAAETVRGLGGLYRRAGADDASLATIQAAARRRLAEHFGLPPDSTAADLAAYLPGIPPEQVERLLGDPQQDLATTAEAVQNLVRHVKGNVT